MRVSAYTAVQSTPRLCRGPPAHLFRRYQQATHVSGGGAGRRLYARREAPFGAALDAATGSVTPALPGSSVAPGAPDSSLTATESSTLAPSTKPSAPPPSPDPAPVDSLLTPTRRAVPSSAPPSPSESEDEEDEEDSSFFQRVACGTGCAPGATA